MRGSARDVELVLGDLRPARRRSCRAGAGPSPSSARPIGQELRVSAAGLVAVGHEEEGRVVAVGLQDAARLAVEPLVDRQAAAEAGRAVRPGGAPRPGSRSPSSSAATKAASGGHQEWKRIMFRPCALAMRMMRLQDSTSVGGWPVFGKIAHSRVPRKKIFRPLIDELRPLRADLPQAEANRPFVPAVGSLEIGTQDLDDRRELVPGGGFRAESDLGLEGAARGHPNRRGTVYGPGDGPPARSTSRRTEPRPGCPVALPIVPRTVTVCASTWGIDLQVLDPHRAPPPAARSGPRCRSSCPGCGR